MTEPNSSPVIRIGVIGCGRIANVHLRHLRSVPNVRVAALCDLDVERARALGAQVGAEEVCRDVADLLRLQLDAVHVLTPPMAHAETAIAALEQGMHVLVEKPMATTAAAARRMQEVALATRRILCVDHNRLFDPAIVRARELVASGAIGTLLSAESYQGVNVQEGGPAAAPLAMWLNLGPHPLYLLRAFVGEIGEWHACGGSLGELRAVLKGTHGLGYLCFSPGTSPYLNALTLHGTKATIQIDLNTMTLLFRRTRRLPSMVAKAALNVEQGLQLLGSTARTALQVVTRRTGTYPGIGEVIRRFYGAVAGKEAPPTTPADGQMVVELLEQIWARTHQNGSAPQARRRVWTGRLRGGNGHPILVTGASGFLGRRVVAALTERGLRVRAMVHTVDLPEEWGDVEPVTATLGDEDSVARAVAGVQAVVHCAARVARPGNRTDFFRDNVNGTGQLLQAARSAGVERFVHMSSIAVYGRNPESGPIGEQVGYDPHPDRRGAYTWSKIAADRLVQQFGYRTGLRTVILRPGILVGPGGPEFLARLCLGVFRGRVLVVGRRWVRLPLVHVDDAGRAAAQAVVAPGAKGAYNLVDQVLTQDEWLAPRAGRSLRPLYISPHLAAIPALGLEAMAWLLRRGSPTLSRYKIRRATDSVRYDTTRARLDLGWTPETGVRVLTAGPERREVDRHAASEPRRAGAIVEPGIS